MARVFAPTRMLQLLSPARAAVAARRGAVAACQRRAPLSAAAAAAAPVPTTPAAAAAAGTPEAAMAAVLRAKLGAEVVEVKDVSGGCGSFYTVLVVAPQFEGMPTMKQHRCVVCRG